MYRLYTLGLLAFFGVRLPGLLAQALVRGRYRQGLGERLGRIPAEAWGLGPGRRPIWIHAVSVGEVLAATPLVRRLADSGRGPLLLSTVTETGNGVARDRLGAWAAGICFFPFDLPGPVGRALDAAAPRLVILTETEIWPNFLAACAARRIPVALVNGRISDRSFRRYRLVRRPLARALEAIGLFGMQTERDADRIRALGAPADRVRVLGNLKFDAGTGGAEAPDGARLRRILGIEDGRPVLVAGSTHRGEEAVILDAFRRLRAEVPDLFLVLGPRHPERATEVGVLLRECGLPWRRRSEEPRWPVDLLLLDTMGELSSLYALATVAFVGGSLVAVGGHNILEPAAAGRPILFGPRMENFAEIAATFVAAGAAVQVGSAEEVAPALRDLLRRPERAEEMGVAAQALVARHRGATARTLAALEPYL